MAPEEKCGRNGMAQGTVKCFNDEKSCGFISRRHEREPFRSASRIAKRPGRGCLQRLR
ncbi:MAG: cold shock domain-containing protein [Rubrobacter sp.]|nr:cold shock domain-containing protein [Rubrobacter sp.]